LKRSFTKLVLLVGFSLMTFVPAFAQEDIVIDFVHIFAGEGDTRRDVLRGIADAFEAENPGITINLSAPSPDYIENFNRSLLDASQGNAPHVVQVEEGLTQLAIDSGFFLPIQDLASEEQLAQLEGILPVVRAYYEVSDVTWSVPWNSSNPVVYYNKTLTDLLGVEVPTDRPMTFAEVIEICERITSFSEAIKAVNPAFTACISFPVASWFAEQWVAMQNGLIANNDNGRSARATEMLYTSPEMLNVGAFYQELTEKGLFTYTGTPNNYNGEGALFGGGATVFHINSTAGITLFVDGFAGAGVNLGIAPLFVPNEEATNGVTVGGASVWVTAGKSEAETQAATDWVFFLTNAENDIRWHQGSGYFPNRAESIEYLSVGGLFVDADGAITSPDAEGAVEVSWFETLPFFRVALDQLQASQSNFATQGAVVGPSNEVRTILAEAFQSIIDGGISASEALEAAKTRSDAVLADYNATIGE